mmetsp:Transcript_30941/g.23020  ORF Transcript_30941/g.23020 Transcript_30941/m.23020 type:complete len:80 (+) Transcript_30941:163-402(+)
MAKILKEEFLRYEAAIDPNKEEEKKVNEEEITVKLIVNLFEKGGSLSKGGLSLSEIKSFLPGIDIDELNEKLLTSEVWW